VDANPAARRIIGREPAELMGRPVAEFLEQRQDLVDRYWGVEEAQAEITVRVADVARDFEIRISPLRNRHGDLTGRIVLLHDITDFKETQRALIAARERAEEANRLKSEFLATMSHELRTPLHAINGYVNIMLAGIAGGLNDIQRKNLERVLVNGRHLLSLIDDVLDLSRIEAGTLTVTRQPVRLREWLDDTVSDPRETAEKKGLRFETALDPTLPRTVISDPARLKQIAANLISNAIKFTDKGHVRVEVKRLKEDRWALVVIDTGAGIPAYALEYIFEAFRQVDSSYQRQHGGTGLGLAIVRRVALMLGGTVGVSSVEGEGSTFTVTLPLATGSAAEKAEEAERSRQQK
jgi:PAS domain S-box-containing protein